MVDGKNQSPSRYDAKSCCVVSKKHTACAKVAAVLCQAGCPGSPDGGQLTKTVR